MPPSLRPKFTGPSVTFNVKFLVTMREAMGVAAKERGITAGELVRQAVDNFLGNVKFSTPEKLGGSEPDLENIPRRQSEPDPEHSLANAEKAFEMGVEAACERLSKNTRLNVRMATGMTMGEDIAQRIKKDLIG